jgi:opacity protein-like surface antigen
VKNIFFLLIFVFSFSLIEAQRKDNIGFFAGASYYYGDINPDRLFYSPGFAFGGIFRYNINKRYAFRLNGYFTRLSGDPNDFSDVAHDIAPSTAFNQYIFDAACQVEFNFFPYFPTLKKWDYTTYISAGVGYASVSYVPITIPFGAGFKLNVTNNICTGVEWSWRKTFNDVIDGTENATDINSIIHNNDWYSFLGIFVTYKFFNYTIFCPTYDD